MIFQASATLFLAIMFFMLFSSRHAYFLRIPVLCSILFGVVCLWYGEAASAVAHFFGVGRAADLVFYLCVLLAFYCFFTLYLKQEIAKENITILVRKLAIDDARAPLENGEG